MPANAADYLDLVASSRIFSGVSRESILESLTRPSAMLTRFRPGEIIFSIQKNQGYLGFVCEGRADVEKILPSGQRLLLSRHTAGDVFGILPLFSKADDFPVTIRAQNGCAALFIPLETVQELYYAQPKFAENIIRYLASRVLYLNRRIEGFAAVTAEEKLASYLKENMIENDGRLLVKLNLSMTDLAAALGLGRASLYRALGTLGQSGVISRSGGEIEITDPAGLNAALAHDA